MRASLIVQGQVRPPCDDGVKDGEGEDEGNQNPSRQPPVYELAGVYTRPADRGCGLGGALMGAAVAQAVAEARQAQRPEGVRGADEAGGDERERPGYGSPAVEIKTVVYTSNRRAVEFYERCGFVARGPPRPSANPLKGPAHGAFELDMFLCPVLD